MKTDQTKQKEERRRDRSGKTGEKSKYSALVCQSTHLLCWWLLGPKGSPVILGAASPSPENLNVSAGPKNTGTEKRKRGRRETRGGEEGVSSQRRAGKEGGSNREQSFLYNK